MLKTTIQNFIHDESGATAIEYGLIATLVSVASILALQALGNSLSGIFDVVGSKLDNIASEANSD
jgi:pilus assembly protein Flp/PilA